MNELAEVILFTSGKGGVGKTTIAANIGASLAHKNKKTLIIDMNQGLRGCDIALGLENLVVYNIFDALYKRCRMSQVVIQDPKRPNLSLLPASQTRKQMDVDSERLKEIMQELRKHFDYILIDGCSGMEMGFEHSALDYDWAVILCTGDVMSVRAADRVKAALKKDRNVKCKLLLNRFRPELSGNDGMLSPEEIEDMLGLDLIGLLKEDDALYLSSNKGETLEKQDSEAGDAISRIAKRILGIGVQIPKPTARSVSGSIFRNIFRR